MLEMVIKNTAPLGLPWFLTEAMKKLLSDTFEIGYQNGRTETLRKILDSIKTVVDEGKEE